MLKLDGGRHLSILGCDGLSVRAIRVTVSRFEKLLVRARGPQLVVYLQLRRLFLHARRLMYADSRVRLIYKLVMTADG